MNLDEPLAPAMRILYDRLSAARMLSMSERRIDDLRRAGSLTAVRDGREWKFTAMHLQRYADSLKTFDEIEAETAGR